MILPPQPPQFRFRTLTGSAGLRRAEPRLRPALPISQRVCRYPETPRNCFLALSGTRHISQHLFFELLVVCFFRHVESLSRLSAPAVFKSRVTSQTQCHILVSCVECVGWATPIVCLALNRVHADGFPRIHANERESQRENGSPLSESAVYSRGIRGQLNRCGQGGAGVQPPNLPLIGPASGE